MGQSPDKWPPPPTSSILIDAPAAQSGSLLCPLVMDYCKEEGGAVCVTLIDEVSSAGVPGDADNGCVCRGGGY